MFYKSSTCYKLLIRLKSWLFIDFREFTISRVQFPVVSWFFCLQIGPLSGEFTEVGDWEFGHMYVWIYPPHTATFVVKTFKLARKVVITFDYDRNQSGIWQWASFD